MSMAGPVFTKNVTFLKSLSETNGARRARESVGRNCFCIPVAVRVPSESKKITTSLQATVICHFWSCGRVIL